jgi:hypothetical protein
MKAHVIIIALFIVLFGSLVLGFIPDKYSLLVVPGAMVLFILGVFSYFKQKPA